MSTYRVHTVDSAPELSKQALRDLTQSFGLIPNVAAAMAASPVLINGFLGLFHQVHGGTFSEAQIQILLLTNAVSNRCAWAVAFHSALALKEGIAPADVQALRERRTPDHPQHAALSTLSRSLIEKRGGLDHRDLRAFLDCGFRQEQVFEVIAALAASTMTNYAGNVAQPTLEAAFQPHEWTPSG
jgi:alkylhydroperoxidase family enzyme